MSDYRSNRALTRQPQDRVEIDQNLDLYQDLRLAFCPSIGTMRLARGVDGTCSFNPAYIKMMSTPAGRGLEISGEAFGSHEFTTASRAGLNTVQTALAVIYVRAAGVVNAIWGHGHNGTYHTRLSMTTTGTIEVHPQTNSAGVQHTGAVALEAGRVYVVIGTDVINAATGRRSLWINGVADGFSETSKAVIGSNNGSFSGRVHVSSTAGNVVLLLGVGWSRALSIDEIDRVSRNPWQLFKSRPRTVWYTASAGGVQVGVPISTITAGAWTAVGAATLHEAIDETAASDSDYIVTTSASACEVRLTSLSAPVAGTRTVKYRIGSSSSSDLQVDLVQGTTIVQTWTHTGVPTAVTLYEQTLTGSVTDYTDLRLRFTAS